jgi:hypothetical protein
MDEIKKLTPENIKIEKDNYDSLTVEIPDENKKYYGVFASSLFPITNIYKFISLFYQDITEKIIEIGIIEQIDAFPEEEKKLILDSLNKYYFSYEIFQIFSVKLEFGMLFFDVETDKGHKKFVMRWEHSKAIDYGAKGKILIDIFEDRYVIPNVEKLHPYDYKIFTRFIYW